MNAKQQLFYVDCAQYAFCLCRGNENKNEQISPCATYLDNCCLLYFQKEGDQCGLSNLDPPASSLITTCFSLKKKLLGLFIISSKMFHWLAIILYVCVFLSHTEWFWLNSESLLTTWTSFSPDWKRRYGRGLLEDSGACDNSWCHDTWHHQCALTPNSFLMGKQQEHKSTHQATLPNWLLTEHMCLNSFPRGKQLQYMVWCPILMVPMACAMLHLRNDMSLHYGTLPVKHSLSLKVANNILWPGVKAWFKNNLLLLKAFGYNPDLDWHNSSVFLIP